MFSKIPVPARLVALAALAVIPWLSACEPAVATYTVTTPFDAVDALVGDGVCATAAGQCSLRAAVQEGNAVLVDGPIDVVLATTEYGLTLTGAGEDAGATGDLDLTRRFRFVGTRVPPAVTRIGASDTDRVFDVHPGGGVQLTDIAVLAGTAPLGGLIRANGGDVTLIKSQLTSASADAGGLIFSDGGTVTLTDSVLGDATASVGGALVADRLVMTRSTIAGSAAVDGGAVALTEPGTASTIDSSTIADNRAQNGSVVKSSGALVIHDSAIVENSSTAGSLSGGPAVQVANSILDASAGADCGAPLTSLDGNVASTASCGLTAPADLQGARLELVSYRSAGLGVAPFYDTQYVVDAGTGCLPADMAGAARPSDGDLDGAAECDRGPLESTMNPVTFTVSSPVDAPDPVPGDGLCTTAINRCTLRAAVQEANARPTADRVRLEKDAIYVLSVAGAGEDAGSTGDLDITGDLQIDATGDSATIDANDIDRVFDVHAGQVVFDRLAITDGTEAAGGGGIRAAAGTDVSVIHTTITANLGVAGGGGIRTAGELRLDRSVLHHNGGSSGGGGGLFVVSGGHATIVNSTVHANNAVRGSGLSVARGAQADIEGTTIAGNTAGVGISVAGAISLEWSIVANHTAGNCSVPVTSLGFNLDSGATCGLSAAGDTSNADPLLGPLQNNSGSTFTMKPAAGSPATSTGNFCSLPWDQRDLNRNLGSGCERGAVEISS